MDTLKTIEVQILNAFVDNNTGGNPAGVVLNADDLSDQNKLDIAKKVGLSETAFVSKSKTEDFKLDFFTPNKQIAHCGHATVATFSYLKQIGALLKDNSSKETIDGKRKQIAGFKGKLGNEGYVKNAKPEMVEETRLKLIEAEADLAAAEAGMAALASAPA